MSTPAPISTNGAMSALTPLNTNGDGDGNTASGSESLASSTVLLPILARNPDSQAFSARPSKTSFGAESTMSLLVDSLKDRLLFAVPKKGRLHEKCLELLSGESRLHCMTSAPGLDSPPRVSSYMR